MAGFLPTAVATIGQTLGLPEMGLSEKLSGSSQQTAPAYTGGGILGSGGYVNSPVSGGSSIYPISGGTYQSGPFNGQSANGAGNYNVLGATTANPPPSAQTPTSNNNTGGSKPASSNTPNDFWDDAQNHGYYKGQFFNDKNKMIAAGWSPGGNGGPQGVSQGDIDNAYNEANGFYDQQYNGELANKQNFLNQYTGLYDAQRPGLDQAYQQGVTLNNQQKDSTQQQSNNAIDSARSLYNELSQGVRQRFGGTNSAGDFANAFYGREFQKNLGNVQNTTGQNMQSLNNQGQDILGQYQANLKELESKKAAAQAQAQDVFQQRLDAINNARGQLAQNKAAAKIQALQDYRNTVNNFMSQANQTAQQIYASHVASADQLRNTVAGYQAYTGKPVDLASITAPMYSTIGGGQQLAYGAPSIVGNSGYGTNRDPNNPYGTQ